MPKIFATLIYARSTPLLLLLASGILLLSSSRTSAGLIFEIQNSSAVSGGVGSFDVVLHDTGGSYKVSGFSLQLTLAANSGVQFTGATTSTTTAAYLFGAYQSGPAPFASDPSDSSSAARFPLSSFVASDSDLTGPDYFVGINTDARFGLAHVTYSVTRGTPIGAVNVGFNLNGTSLSDINGNAIPFSAPAATISVVPEPASAILLVAGLVGTALVRPAWRRVR